MAAAAEPLPRYDPFAPPDAAAARGVVEPYDCYVEVPEGAEPDIEHPEVGDEDFYGWYGARMVGSECVNVLRINSCNRGAVADIEAALTGQTGPAEALPEAQAGGEALLSELDARLVLWAVEQNGGRFSVRAVADGHAETSRG